MTFGSPTQMFLTLRRYGLEWPMGRDMLCGKMVPRPPRWKMLSAMSCPRRLAMHTGMPQTWKGHRKEIYFSSLSSTIPNVH